MIVVRSLSKEFALLTTLEEENCNGPVFGPRTYSRDVLKPSWPRRDQTLWEHNEDAGVAQAVNQRIPCS